MAIETEVEVRLPAPHKKQLEFIESEVKRIIVRAGRRGGKTVGVSIRNVKRFLSGRRQLYLTPTSEQLTKWWFEVTMALDPLIRLGVFKKNEAEHFIERVGTEQRIKGKTAWNADTARGDYADDITFDEWQLMDEDAWGLVGAPMLLDNNGDAVFIYTPPSLKSSGGSKAKDPRHAAKMFKKAQEDPRWLAIHFTSKDNPHISKDALEEIVHDMTQLAYQQEILALDIDIVIGALWTLETLNRYRVAEHPPLVRVVVGVDPPGGATECGIVVSGRGRDGHYYVINDGSLRASPDVWAATALGVYDKEEADKMIGEINFGGDMVESTIKKTAEALNKSVNYQSVRASRGKAVRAEPIAAAYEQGRVHHVGEFPFLEEELTSWVPGDRDSPNRLDACVWSLTELMDGVDGGTMKSKRSIHFAGSGREFSLLQEVR
ncbi:hypothetical protein LCGC14_1201720 [marine sediment metagenome]|uniref:Terminase large subunit gp17-like C-terminal domain-containing protein n=1 Tax=marine sediment metagenome TaxID=412755 RepID=A0A0F9M3Z0_9ZZZZ